MKLDKQKRKLVDSDKPRKQSICFFVQHSQHYKKLLPLYQLLKDEVDVVFLVDDNNRPKNSGITKLPKSNIIYFQNPSSLITVALDPQSNFMLYTVKKLLWIAYLFIKKFYYILHHQFDKEGSIYRTFRTFTLKFALKIKNKCKNFGKIIYDAFIHIYIFRKKINSVMHVLKDRNIDMLILAEANVEYLSEAIIKACEKDNIATLVVPYTFCGPSEPARAYYNSYLHTASWHHHFFLKKNWFYKFQSKELIRVPFIQAVIMQKYGLTPPNPWIQESCTADIIVAESKKILTHYQKMGIKQKQLSMIGDISHDLIFASLKNKNTLKKEVYQELSLESENKTAIFAIYPDYSSKYKDSFEFKSYEESLKFVISQLLLLKDYNVILCLHPSLNKESFAYLESERVKITSRPTNEVIVIGDLYIASVSATIKWAIAIGMPVINYDLYKFKYDDYISAPGVINIETKKEFISIIAKIKTTNYLQELKEKQISVKEQWGIIDGQFSVRFKKLINKLIKKRK